MFLLFCRFWNEIPSLRNQVKMKFVGKIWVKYHLYQYCLNGIKLKLHVVKHHRDPDVNKHAAYTMNIYIWLVEKMEMCPWKIFGDLI